MTESIRSARRTVNYSPIQLGDPPLDEISVEADWLPPWPFFASELRRLGYYPRKIDPRQRGIGTLLLQRLLTDADDIEEVWGSVVQKDMDRWPGLQRCYERVEFTASDPDSECLRNAVKKIRRIRPSSNRHGLVEAPKLATGDGGAGILESNQAGVSRDWASALLGT